MWLVVELSTVKLASGIPWSGVDLVSAPGLENHADIELELNFISVLQHVDAELFLLASAWLAAWLLPVQVIKDYRAQAQEWLF